MTLDTKLQASAGTSLRSLVRGFLLTHQSGGHSPHTVKYYKGTLGRFLWYAEGAAWTDDARLLTEWQVREFLAYVASETERWGGNSTSSHKKAAPRTLHHYYRSLITFFNWVIREGFLPYSPMSNIRMPRPKKRVIRPYTPAQIRAMLQVCDYDYSHGARFLASRNRAIILVLLDSGLRLAELAEMRLQDIDTERGWVTVWGKGAKERVVRIGQVAQKALWRYLVYRPHNGLPELWLNEEGRPLQARGVQEVVKRLKQRAGITEGGGCHRMRHTFALSFLRADRNPFNLQYLLGHSSLEMVRHYTATLGMEDALEAHVNASPADLLGLK